MRKSRFLAALFSATVVVGGLADSATAGIFKIDFSDRPGIGAPDDWDAFRGENDLTKGDTLTLTDWSGSGDNDVLLTILDDNFIGNQSGLWADGEQEFIFEGIEIPLSVINDYAYRDPDIAGTTSRFSFENLNAGEYSVAVVEGRRNDGNGQFATIWVGDGSGSNEPAATNTGDYSNGVIQSVDIKINEGDTLWYRHFEDNSGGVSGIIIFQDIPLVINGGGETYRMDFDQMETARALPSGWSGTTNEGTARLSSGLGLTDGFLTVPGSPEDGVLGVLNLGGNEGSFGPAPDGHVATWTAELGGANDIFGRDDVIADNASDRALGISRVLNNDKGELDFEIEIVDATMRAFVLDWDLEIWGGDPDAEFRSAEGPGMKVDVAVDGTSYKTMTENLIPGALFDSTEDGDSDHNATLINGNAHSIRGISTGILETTGTDGAVGNMVHVNFNTNWNGATDDGDNGWYSAIDNVQLRALAPGDADANGVVDVADLLALLGGQKFNKGVDGVTWGQGDFNADDQFNTGDLLAMLSFLSGTFPSDPYASEAGGANDAVADIIVNSETGEVTVDLAGHTVSAVIIESASEIFNGSQPQWDTTSQFPSTLPGELGNVLFSSTASGTDELGAVISAEFLGRDKEFYLQDLDLNILIASEGGALTKGNVIVVPEPSTWMLLGLGSLAIVGVIRRRGE